MSAPGKGKERAAISDRNKLGNQHLGRIIPALLFYLGCTPSIFIDMGCLRVSLLPLQIEEAFILSGDS
jgi:hypothetical protein